MERLRELVMQQLAVCCELSSGVEFLDAQVERERSESIGYVSPTGSRSARGDIALVERCEQEQRT